MNLQEYIAQQTAPSLEAVDMIELLSLEASFREDMTSLGQALNVTSAIEALDIDKLSNEAYQVGIESILTTAGMDHIPTELVVPSFESSQALAISSGAQHEEKGAKKKGILKRIWDFIKSLWQKIKAKFASIFKAKRSHTAQLMLQQSKIESAASSMGYSFVGHEKKEGPAALGFHEAKKVSLGYLGTEPSAVAHGAHTLAEHINKLTTAVDAAFHKLLAIDYNHMPAGKDLVEAVGGYTDKFTAGETVVTMSIGRMGAQVNSISGKHVEFNAHPESIPVKELVQARHVLVAAWDAQTKKMETFNGQLDVLEKIIAQQEAKIATMTDPAEIERSQNAANGLNRGLHFAGALAACPVENAVAPALREIDKLLGVK